jgi:O-antigen/teichoic acid export membrane protein
VGNPFLFRRAKEVMSGASSLFIADGGREAVAHSLFLFIPQMVGNIISFPLFVLLAHAMNRADYANFAYARSWILFAAPILTVGLAFSANKFLPAYFHQNNMKSVRGYIRFGISCISLAACILFLLALFCGKVLAAFGGVRFALMAVLSCAGLAVLQFLFNVDRATYATRWANVPRFLGMPLLLLLGVGAWTLTGVRLGAVCVMLLFLISVAVSVVFQFAILNFGPGESPLSGKARFERRLWLSVAIPVLLTSSANDLLRQADMLMVGLVASKEAIAHYHAANLLSNFLSIIFAATHAVAIPRVSQELAAGRIDQAERHLGIANLLAIIGTGAVAIACGVVAVPLLRVFGPDFVSARYAFYILLLAQLSISALGMSMSALLVAKRERLALITVLCAVPVHVCLVFVLFKVFGMTGAALACLISVTAVYTICTVEARYALGVRSSILPIWTRMPGND